MALILNPNIEDINQLLTNEQIEASKRIIQTRMKKYPPFKQTQQTQQKNRYSRFKKTHEEIEVPLTPIQNLLENRSSSNDLFNYWKKRIHTEEQQLAYVALEVLGILVTSSLTERSFSKSRYVINNLRTNVSPENARDQMIVKCNKEIAKKVLETIDLNSSITE